MSTPPLSCAFHATRAMRQICRVIPAAVLLFAVASSPTAFAQSGCAREFLNPQYSHPYNTAPAAPTPSALLAGTPLGGVQYTVAGDATAHSLEDYLGKFCTTGFMVLKDDRVVFERYLQGRKPGDHLLSASLSKSILALLLGVAISEGKLALSDRVVDILPEYAASAFASATVEDLLRMASGVELKNSFEAGADSDNRAINPMIEPLQNVAEYLKKKTARAAPPGAKFDYNGAQTAVLGMILKRRTGGSDTDYLEEKIWAPMGAESAGYWIKNRAGDEGVAGQFAATLRDYARLGSLVMNRGRINGKQLVPADWIEQMSSLRRDKAQPRKAPYYGLHIWIPQAAGGRAFFWGTNGQNIFIDPVARVVIVHTGNSHEAEFNGNAHLFPLRDAIVRALSAPPGERPKADM